MLRRRDLLAGCLAAQLARPAGDRIRLGCQTRAYGSPIREREKLLSVLEDLADLGYEGFETNFASLSDSFATPQPMRKEIAWRRIRFIGLHMSVGFFDLARLEQEQAQIARVARAMRALGGTHLMLSGHQPPPALGGWNGERLGEKCRQLDRAGRACRELGVRLCVHNHGHELQHGAEHLKALLTRTTPQDVSFTLDVGNPFPLEFDVPRMVREYAGRIAAFHLRDTARGKEVLMGTGEFDFAGLAGVLRQTGWGGWLIVEINRRSDIPSRQLVQMARDHLRKTMRI